jgi:phosphoglycolate phosphatase
VGTKGVLWFIFFGLAKTFQYSGLAVLGTAGIARIKKWWHSRKNKD